MKHMKRMFFAALLGCLAVGLPAVPALTLSDAEYRRMMKDPEDGEELVEADKDLNQAWAKAQKSLSAVPFEILKKDQNAWLAHGRDEVAKKYMEDVSGVGVVVPYAHAARKRAQLLVKLVQKYEESETTEIRLVNETDEKILVAVARDSFADTMYGDDTDQFDSVYGKIFDISKGWWSLEPGETKRICPFKWLEYCSYYFYAVSESGGHIWGGSADEGTGSKLFWVNRAGQFECNPDQELPEGEQVWFQKFTAKHWKYWTGKNGLEARELAVKFRKDTDVRIAEENVEQNVEEDVEDSSKSGNNANVKINEENFPDENLRQWVKENVAGGKDVLTKAQIAAVKDIDVFGFGGISNQKGLEYFTALEFLRLGQNGNGALTELDMSYYPELKTLYCSGCALTKLDVSRNPALEDLRCEENKLTELDVSHNPALKVLWCGSNELTELDVSHNPVLREVSCGWNRLTELDVSHNPALDDLSCAGNRLTELDVSQNPALEILRCDNNSLTKLDLSHNPALERLTCNGTRLTRLDVSHNPALIELSCKKTAITELDLSNNDGALEEGDFPETAQVKLPNGDRITMADFQLRRTPDGKYQLDLSRYADKIDSVYVYIPGAVLNEDVPVTSSGGIYTFAPCNGFGKIRYKLGDRGEDNNSRILILPLVVKKDISSVPLVKSVSLVNAPKGKVSHSGGNRSARQEKTNDEEKLEDPDPGTSESSERKGSYPAGDRSGRHEKTNDEERLEDPAIGTSESSDGIPAAISGNRVNIRQAPSLKGKVLLQLNNGAPVVATGKTARDHDGGVWFQIITPSGKTGWVSGRYIRDR